MDFTPWLPEPDDQNSLSPIFDSNSCGIFGLVDFIEIMVFYKTGIRVDYSKHGAATQAGIQNNVDPNGHIWGSYVAVDLASIKNNGLLTQEQWPDVPNFSHDQFFAPIPQNLSGRAFLDQWMLSDLLPVTPETLKTAPILLQIQFPNKAVHFVVQINDTQYFDSYTPNIKPIGYNGSVILNKWTLSLISKNMQLTNDKGVVYLVGGLTKFKIGIASQDLLSVFGDEPIVNQDTSAIPETYTIADGFIIHKK